MTSTVVGKTIYKIMGGDTHILGRELLEEKNILAVRAAKAMMSAEKGLLRECIVNVLSKTNNHRGGNFLISSSVTSSWQSYCTFGFNWCTGR